MWNLLAIVALTAVGSADVSATKLDGTTISGRLESWQSERITLTTAAGSLDIADTELLLLRLSPAASGNAPKWLVELVDGTVLPLADFSASGSNAVVTLEPPPATRSQQLTIPQRQVRSVQFERLEEPVAAQWREIRAQQTPSDLLVVSKRGGKSLDYLEGVIGAISERDVEFKVDGKSVRMPRGKVAGLIYYRPEAPGENPPHCVVSGSNGLRIAAAAVQLDGDIVNMSTSTGIQIAWPLEDVRTADFSAGKVIYLSDLEPAAQSWQPLVSLPAAASQALKFGLPRFDRSAAGGPLALAYADQESSQPGGIGNVRTFAKGLALRSRTELVYRLPQGYRRVITVAGIDPTTSVTGQVMLTILGDDRVLAEMPIAGNDAPLPIELDVTGVQRLKIVVDFGDNLDTGDWLNLCDARIVK